MMTFKKRKSLMEMLTDRYLIFGIVVSLMFGIIVYQFYKIQIIEYSEHTADLRDTVQKEVEIPAVRGCIYDRYGKPLAINQTVNVLKFNPEVSLKKGELDQILLRVADLLEAKGENYIDHMPISKTLPFIYTGEESSVKRFIVNYVPCNVDEREEFYAMSASDLMDYLRGEDVFNIDESINDEKARKIIAMRLEIRQTTYQKYKQVTLAESVSMDTVTAIEEHQDDYAGITVEAEAKRYYTCGKPLGNILGYTRKITESQYESMKNKGYDQDDVVGQVGIEAEEEEKLKGIKGNKLIEVDDVGRTVFTLEKQEAVKGNDIYLSIDADLQISVYEALEKRLAQGIIKRLQGVAKTTPLTGRDVLVSMAENNQLDLTLMSAKTTSKVQQQLYEKIVTSYNEACKQLEETEKNLPAKQRSSLSLKQHFASLLENENSPITDTELLITFMEQGSLKVSEVSRESIYSGAYNLNELLIEALEQGNLKPDQMDIEPCSGTAVIVNPNNGETLALVSYPSYDNNDFIENFNEIYRKINDGIDGRNLEVNRALKTAKAPGSTFKMITGIAGLEEGVIEPDTLIYDSGEYTKAGNPPLKCWIFTNTGSGHGDENMEGALEVSCNFYFSEVGYRLSEKFGIPYGGIKVLAEYAEMFGLGQKSGIELEEIMPNVSNPTNAVATQAARFLNRIRRLKDNESDKTALFQEIQGYLEKGFYRAGAYSEDNIQSQVEDLVDSELKKRIDTDLGIALSESLAHIYEKLLEDYQDAYSKGVSSTADKVAKMVMAGDTSLSLKYRIKLALKEILASSVESGTRKAIVKAIDKMPEGLLEQAFLQTYEEALDKCERENVQQEVKEELQRQIIAMKQEEFNYKDLITDKVIERILQIILEDYFEEVEMEWTARDNISSAIGQGEHAYTPVQMAKYIAGIANAKKVYNLTILSGMKDNKESGQMIMKEPTIFNILNLQKETIDTIRTGMRKVAAGDYGTARQYYAQFPVELAAKTGTAQEGEHENSWVVSFAPYNEPEVAAVISMYGTDGLGSCTYELLTDIYSLFFKLDETKESHSIGNQFIQ